MTATTGNAELRALFAKARDANADIVVSEDDFVAHVRARATPPVTAETAAQLYFALACVRGDPAALRGFEARCAPVLLRMARRAKLGDADANDLVQRLRMHLLVGTEGSPPKLAEYSGRGDLAAWLRVVALRAAVRAARGAAAGEGEDEDAILAALSSGDDPELSYLKAVYRSAFREAFAAAIASLDAPLRTLLRQHLVDGLTIDELAPIYGVHRATAARRLQEARETLLARVRREFAQRARVSDREMNSVLRLVESRFNVTLKRLLG